LKPYAKALPENASVKQTSVIAASMFVAALVGCAQVRFTQENTSRGFIRCTDIYCEEYVKVDDTGEYCVYDAYIISRSGERIDDPIKRQESYFFLKLSGNRCEVRDLIDIPRSEYFTRQEVLDAATWLASAVRERRLDFTGITKLDAECMARGKRLRISSMWYPIDGSESHVVFYVEGCARRVEFVVALDPDVRSLHAAMPVYSPIVVDEPL
jgi:hypothetical protein